MVPAAIAMYLGEHGRDAVAVLDVADLVGRPDSEILEWAARQMRVLVTLNIEARMREGTLPTSGSSSFL